MSDVSATHYPKHGWLEACVSKTSSYLALGIIAAGFVLRLVYAQSCYLNPDEASHFGSARLGDWSGAYKAAFMQAHPPLFILVLHAILFFGRSELILRLPSLIGGTAALWLTFAWIRRSIGGVSALAGLGFMALSPASISASTEVRQYGLLLCFVCGALYATERAFSERSSVWTMTSGLLLLGALLTHYSAIVVLLVLGVYVALRSVVDGMPRRILFTVVGCSLVLVTVLSWLYFRQIRRFVPSGQGSTMGYLRQYYYLEGRETLLGFVWRSFSGTFEFAVGIRRLAFLFMFIFLVGLALLLTGRTKAPRSTGLLVVLAFIAGFTAALLQVLPFAGSRHQTYLLPFLAAGISAALSCLPHGLRVPLLLLGIAAAPLWISRTGPDNDPRVLPTRDMSAAIGYIERIVPYGSPLFVDFETREVLRYYLVPNGSNSDALRANAVVEEQLGDYRVVVPSEYVWDFHPDKALKQVAASALALRIPPGDPLWVVSAAWLESPLASRLPSGRDLDSRVFGRISVIKVSNWGQSEFEVNSFNAKPAINGFGTATSIGGPQLSPSLLDFLCTDGLLAELAICEVLQ